jgi:uncharacterized protein
MRKVRYTLALTRALPFFFITFFAVTRSRAIGAQEFNIPAPRGMLNDFAHLILPAQATRIEALANEVRAKSGGELAVVTLSDLSGNSARHIGMRIGVEWKVGAAPKSKDDRRANCGVVVLVVPKETSHDGNGYVDIELGTGTNRFFPDSAAARIISEATPLLRRRDYGDAVELITRRIAERFAREFHFTLGK